MSELKPCPFCGCEDIRYKVHQDHLGNWHGSIYCREYYNKINDDDRCWSLFYARSPNSREEVIEKLIKKWNKRPSNWHTGIPTENGKYLVQYKTGFMEFLSYRDGKWLAKETTETMWGEMLKTKREDVTDLVVAWQRIEP